MPQRQLRAISLLAALALAAAPQLKLPGEANGKVAKLGPCGGLSSIVVESATFGSNCFEPPPPGCTANCAAVCSACTAETCPAGNGAAAGKCSTHDVTDVVAGACGGGQSQCDFPVCIAGQGPPVAAMAVCTSPPARWPLGDPVSPF